MYVVFLKYIFVENFNTSSRSHQPVPWNCNDKILGAKGPRAEGRHMGPRTKGQEKQIPESRRVFNRSYIGFWYLNETLFPVEIIG